MAGTKELGVLSKMTIVIQPMEAAMKRGAFALHHPALYLSSSNQGRRISVSASGTGHQMMGEDAEVLSTAVPRLPAMTTVLILGVLSKIPIVKAPSWITALPGATAIPMLVYAKIDGRIMTMTVAKRINMDAQWRPAMDITRPGVLLRMATAPRQKKRTV